MSDTLIDVYDGRTYIGHVIEREAGRRCEAYDAAENALGVFPSHLKAARAVLEADVGHQREAAA